MPSIYHLARRAEWDEARPTGTYRRSTRGRSLEEVGFVHCSTAEQVERVAALVFGDEHEALVLLTVDVDRLDAAVVFENLEGGAELFPHVYGPIPVAAVVQVDAFERNESRKMALGSAAGDDDH